MSVPFSTKVSRRSAGGVTLDYLQANYYDQVEIDNQINSLEAGKIPTSRLGPQGVSPTIVDRTDTTSNTLVTEQSLLNWVGGNLTEGGNDYQIVQPKLYITDSANTREINSQDGQGNYIVEFIKARVNSSKDGGFDGTDDRRLTTNLAIHNHLQANYLPIGGSLSANVFVSSIIASAANLQSAVILHPQVDRITLTGSSYSADPVRQFARLKTNYHQILSNDTVSQADPNGANTNQPISCQSLLDAAANASFTTQATGEHLLPPSGSSINTHLTTNYVPKSDVVNNSTFSTNNIFTASDVKPPSELAVRVGLDSKPTAQLLSYTAGQPIILGSNNAAVISDTVLNHYAVPIPTSGSGAGKIVARNTNNDGWEFVSSTGSSSSLTIDTHTNATSTATKTAQTIGTGIFYQNGTQLRVQYKSSSSNYQDVLIGVFDTTSPVITILGDNPVSVNEGTTYTDAGATALDNIDGDVTSQIQTTGTVDTTTEGSYYITYTVSDNTGNIASAIRTVNVVSAGPTPLYANYRTSLGEAPLTAPSGMITTSNALPGPYDDYTIQVTFKFNGRTIFNSPPILSWGASVDTRAHVTIVLIDPESYLGVVHGSDDFYPLYPSSAQTDGQYHAIHVTFKNVNGARTVFAYLDGILLGSAVKAGPTNMLESGRYQLWVGDGYGPASWNHPTQWDFEFGEIKDLYIYDVAFYPGSTAPPGWT